VTTFDGALPLDERERSDCGKNHRRPEGFLWLGGDVDATLALNDTGDVTMTTGELEGRDGAGGANLTWLPDGEETNLGDSE